MSIYKWVSSGYPNARHKNMYYVVLVAAYKTVQYTRNIVTMMKKIDHPHARFGTFVNLSKSSHILYIHKLTSSWTERYFDIWVDLE